MAEERVAVELRPLADQERYPALDSIRGVALFGVLMVNLLTGFRVSLMDYIVRFHTDDGWANRVMDVLVAGAIEFKAFALFSLLFGVGVAVQAERAAGRGVWPAQFLVRRFGALLLLGMAHIALVWNGDILTLYAVCGLLMIPFLSLSARGLLLAGNLGGSGSVHRSAASSLAKPGRDEGPGHTSDDCLRDGRLLGDPAVPVGGDGSVHFPSAGVVLAKDTGDHAAWVGRLALWVGAESVAAPASSGGDRSGGWPDWGDADRRAGLCAFDTGRDRAAGASGRPRVFSAACVRLWGDDVALDGRRNSR